MIKRCVLIDRCIKIAETRLGLTLTRSKESNMLKAPKKINIEERLHTRPNKSWIKCVCKDLGLLKIEEDCIGSRGIEIDYL